MLSNCRCTNLLLLKLYSVPVITDCKHTVPTDAYAIWPHWPLGITYHRRFPLTLGIDSRVSLPVLTTLISSLPDLPKLPFQMASLAQHSTASRLCSFTMSNLVIDSSTLTAPMTTFPPSLGTKLRLLMREPGETSSVTTVSLLGHPEMSSDQLRKFLSLSICLRRRLIMHTCGFVAKLNLKNYRPSNPWIPCNDPTRALKVEDLLE